MISVFANVKLIDGQILVKHDLSSEVQSVEKKRNYIGETIGGNMKERWQ